MAEIIVFYEGPIVSRDDAITLGLKRFFTGSPCKFGHISERSTASGSCLVCAAAASNRWRMRNPQRAKEVRENHYARHRTRRNASSRKWRVNHPQEYAASKAASRRKHVTKILAYDREYRNRPAVVSRRRVRRNTEQYLAWQSRYLLSEQRKAVVATYLISAKGKATRRRSRFNRRAREAKVEGVFTREDDARLRQKQKKCHICGKRFSKRDPATLDHVIALADGGRHDPSNIALAHRSCNQRKNKRRTHLI
jgi:hypothetical protein